LTPKAFKAELRKQALEKLAAAPATLDESRAIQERILDLPAFASAGVVSLFVPLPDEPAAELLWEAATHKTICCPAMGPNGPEFRVVRTRVEMKRTARGFFEPPMGAAVDPSLVDLFVVPGLAFDVAGLRLGRGGGYYDRMLVRRRGDSTSVGLVPDRLLVRALPREPHDIPMTHVATERRLLIVPRGETLATR
jgi:5-formyltetrahydrofolate cyclo-ligase